MTTVTEVAPDVFAISTFVPEANMHFGQFLVRDDEPLLFHTGTRALFPVVRDAVRSVLDPATIRWIGFSHYEADECATLNDWLALAPQAEAACSMVGAIVSVNDVALRPARALADGEVLTTGTHRFRFLHTPHVPHCWDAGMLFEETAGTLFCTDLFQQNGERPASTDSDVVGLSREAMIFYQQGRFADVMPYTAKTDGILRRLADLEPRTLAAMHGSAYRGDGGQALRDLAGVFRDVLGAR
jgi:flavorubredoxin